jgi:GH25 family lysozyme M1 (1,4-beta-N-acetylmuramidase)
MANFFRVARSLEFALDLPLALDVEEQAHDPLGGVSAPEYADRVRACLDEMVSEGNRRPLMYCSPGFLARLPDRDFASVADLWVADYNPHLLLPHGFTTWRIWQTSGNRKIAGTEMDDDVFNGSEDELRAWCIYP